MSKIKYYLYTEYKQLFIHSPEKHMRSFLKQLSIFKIIEHLNKSVHDLEDESPYYSV